MLILVILTNLAQRNSISTIAHEAQILRVKSLPHETTLSAIRATVLLANRPRASTRTETSRY